MIDASGRPFETDSGDGAGSDFRIAIGLGQFGGNRLFFNCRLFRLALGFGVVCLPVAFVEVADCLAWIWLGAGLLSLAVVALRSWLKGKLD